MVDSVCAFLRLTPRRLWLLLLWWCFWLALLLCFLFFTLLWWECFVVLVRCCYLRRRVARFDVAWIADDGRPGADSGRPCGCRWCSRTAESRIRPCKCTRPNHRSVAKRRLLSSCWAKPGKLKQGVRPRLDLKRLVVNHRPPPLIIGWIWRVDDGFLTKRRPWISPTEHSSRHLYLQAVIVAQPVHLQKQGRLAAGVVRHFVPAGRGTG